MALTSAAPYLALLQEDDPTLKSYSLTSLNGIVDQLWPEISNNLAEIEELYEDESFKDRELAALIASKVYYNLDVYDLAVKYALVAGGKFDITEKSEFAETIISKAVETYIKLSQKAFTYPEKSISIDKNLIKIVEKMTENCCAKNEWKLALGIALESYRYDVIESIISKQFDAANEEAALSLINYVVSTCSSTIIDNKLFRFHVLRNILHYALNKDINDYVLFSKLIIQLNDYQLAINIIYSLLLKKEKSKNLVAYQIAFDLVQSASQQLLDGAIESINEHPDQEFQKIKKILTGVPTCDFNITFLYKNDHTDNKILDKSKAVLDGKSSIYHNALTFQNAFMHCGTTNDQFIRNNLDWLAKARNWSKFSAAAALGVIHKGNLSQGKTILEPYLPEKGGSAYSQGGSLYGLGLVFAGHGREILNYIRKHIVSGANSNEEDVVSHGACLGVGVAGMASSNLITYDRLKNVLFSESATSGEAAAISMGLVMLGSGDPESLTEMLEYAEQTQHENIVRGLAMGIALLNYGREIEADKIIDTLLDHQNYHLRYGGAFTIALAYCGTGSNSAVKKLLHVAVSDSSDDVRRASVIALGFVLLREYTTVPTIVELLSESHNPHVRYGTAMALGISCAGRGYAPAIEVLEPLSKDPVDFVRQGALIAMSMILIQQNEKTFPKVKEIKELFSTYLSNKQMSIVRFGSAIAHGIIDAGGQNVTIQLENNQTGTLNMKAIVGLAVFVQYWYWFPLTHFLSLSFQPTSIIGVREDLKIPKFEINCHTKQEIFDYPPAFQEKTGKVLEKVEKAVLSTTVKANVRAKLNKAKKEREGDKKEKDIELKEKETAKKEILVEKMDIDDEKVKLPTKDGTEQLETDITSSEDEQITTVRFTKDAYKIQNMTRVLPQQLKYISFDKEGRFVPIRKFRGNDGVVILVDKQPGEKCQFNRTVRQIYDTEAPIPEPFILSKEDMLVESD
ncbi:proteasome regulatory particle base subunit RPN2 [Ascoidea rubescens DSM 1968]|uniref:26S proteasome regulatory subunit RPN2 n=1 Tax=Ascoidea rubescens DSM 1968 TaxID=1344418 RepID=A0A1D2VC83_9ASCO|nr:26S proteasome regulatory complex, non-ATPase subcomplex, Rpn2/Psmd1 subunit [Ascoidea rubescens DSM 1968]ODV59236.1 26S proteasome regulatory complex, non-ATPase subcomplex, Rpn2/Psmd1 subunit [Ascoidea rubescens DSM 1968]